MGKVRRQLCSITRNQFRRNPARATRAQLLDMHRTAAASRPLSDQTSTGEDSITGVSSEVLGLALRVFGLGELYAAAVRSAAMSTKHNEGNTTRNDTVDTSVENPSSTSDLDRLRAADQAHHASMRRAAHADAALAFEALDDLCQFAVVDRQRRLRLEGLDEVVPLEALIARPEQGDDFPTKVAAELALMRRLAAEQVEVDQAGQGIGLGDGNRRAVSHRNGCAMERQNSRPIP